MGQVVHTVRRPDGQLAVESTGRGHPVVLIHGWGVDRRMWAHQIGALCRRFTTISYDRRGFGESTCRADLEQELGDLDAILGQLGFERAALVGMSQGGRVALRYASSRPDRVSALVLQAAPLDGLEPDPGDASFIPTTRLAKLLQSGDRATLLRELSAHAFFRPDARFPEARAEILAMLRDYRGEDLGLSPARGISLEETRKQLAHIASPTLVITGEQETLWLQGVADFTAQAIRGARRRVLGGGGHFVNMTHPEAYNHALLNFLVRATTPWNALAWGSV